MVHLSRREFLYLSLAASAGLAASADAKPADVHQQLLDLAARQEKQRLSQFAAVKTKDDLQLLQKTLREMNLPAHQPVAYSKQNRSNLKSSLHTWIETRKRAAAR